MKNFYDFKIENIKNLSAEEKNSRKKNLDLFFQKGFPNKKNEDWKFTDLNSILGQNFTKIANTDLIPKEITYESINEFDHNFISLMNGKLISKSFLRFVTSLSSMLLKKLPLLFKRLLLKLILSIRNDNQELLS